MPVQIKPSDLFHKYKHVKETQHEPKFSGLPDPHPFDRDDLYEVIPMMEAVMNELGYEDGNILEKLEELMIFEMPRFIETREEVFSFLVSVSRDRISQ